jgi:hypothetical protein
MWEEIKLTAKTVPGLLIVFNLMMEAIYHPKRGFVQYSHGITSQKTASSIVAYLSIGLSSVKCDICIYNVGKTKWRWPCAVWLGTEWVSKYMVHMLVDGKWEILQTLRCFTISLDSCLLKCEFNRQLQSANKSNSKYINMKFWYFNSILYYLLILIATIIVQLTFRVMINNWENWYTYIQ